MSNREIVEGIIADWRRLEASARMRLADGSFPLVLPAEIDSCANCALALERLLAVAEECRKIAGALYKTVRVTITVEAVKATP